MKYDDRVAVYGATQLGCEDVPFVRKTGRVTVVHESGWVNVTLDQGGNYTFHKKQCRLLKKRRRVWINFEGGKMPDVRSVSKVGFIEFIEVKKK